MIEYQATVEGKLGLLPQRIKKRKAKTPEEILKLKIEERKPEKPAPGQIDLLGRMQKKL